MSLHRILGPWPLAISLAKFLRFKVRSLQGYLRQELLCFLFSVRNTVFPDRSVPCKIGDVSFLLVPKGAITVGLWAGREFEIQQLQFILKILEPNTTFLDIGSNVGIYAIAVASKFPSMRTHAFEPCLWTFEVLQENIRLNSLSNVATYRTALGDYTGEAVLNINATWKDGLNTLGRPSHPGCQVVGRETVPITTLDNWIADNGISRVDVMKVDIEGMELLAFKGAKGLLQCEDAPLILYEGYSFLTSGFDYDPLQTMELLLDCGYSVFVLDTQSGKVAPCQPVHGINSIFVAVKRWHPSFSALLESS